MNNQIVFGTPTHDSNGRQVIWMVTEWSRKTFKRIELRAICTSEENAIVYATMLNRHNKIYGKENVFVDIEKRICDHLYASKDFEFLYNGVKEK